MTTINLKNVYLGRSDESIFTCDIKNTRDYFSVCFNEHEIKNISDIDIEEEIEYYKDEYPVSARSYAEAKQEIENIDNMFNEMSEDDQLFYIHDCSCSNNTILEIEDEKFIFLSVGGGQMDIDKSFLIDEAPFFNDVIRFWNTFHLKEIDNIEIKELLKKMQGYKEDLFNDEEALKEIISL